MPDLGHLNDAQGKTVVILTDVTAEGGLDILSANSIVTLLSLKVASIIVVPARLNTDFSTPEARKKLSDAFVQSLGDVRPADLQKLSISSFVDLGISGVAPNIFSSSNTANVLFVNDTTDDHPTAVALRNRWNNAVQEIKGRAFAALHSSIWPLNNKTVLVVTDCETATERHLVLATVRHIQQNTGAKSVHVVVTSPKSSVASEVASALGVKPETAPPAGADSALWKRSVSVSDLTIETCSGDKSKQVQIFTDALVVSHVFINETRSAIHDVVANVAESRNSSQAAGLLRQAVLAIGNLSGVAKLSNGQELLQKVWPINNKRFLFLVDGSVVFNKNHASTAARELTFQSIRHVCRNKGTVIVVPYFVSPDDELIDRKEISKNFQELFDDGSVNEIQIIHPSDRIIERELNKNNGALFINPSNRADIHSSVLKSCDVFVRDTTFFGKSVEQQGNGETLIQAARAGLGHVAIGFAAATLNVDLTPSSPVVFGSSVTGRPNTIGLTALLPSFLTSTSSSSEFGSSSSPNKKTAAALRNASRKNGDIDSSSSFSADFESQDMRKPVEGGEGSLLTNVVSSLSTTILLHPLNLSIYAVPNPKHLPLGQSFLALRCLHAVARELLFHVFSRRTQPGTGRPAAPGWLNSVAAGVLSDPLRAVAYGYGSGHPLNAVVASIGDPITVATTSVMNFAPQASYQLSKYLQRFVGKSPNQIVKFIVAAVSRLIVCLVLQKVVWGRRRYPVDGFGLTGPSVRLDQAFGLAAYGLKEVLALFIETFVQKNFR